MSISQADNHNANPNWHGGGDEMHKTKMLKDEIYRSKVRLEQMRDDKALRNSPQFRKQYAELAKKYNDQVTLFNQLNHKNRPYTINCQRSVVAYEARRRGYDVIASENDGSDANYSKAMEAFGKNYNYLNLGRLPRKNSARNVRVDDKLKRQMKVGQRGRLIWTWRNRRIGHTINVERTSNGLRYVDAQVGHVAKSFKQYMGNNSFTNNGIIYERTDNAKLDIKDLGGVVQPRKGK